jgi:Zn-dependent M28 family amino/carboxypeptidase
VLFTGEEAGFLGSYAHVRLHRAELDRTVAMVTFDLGTGRTSGFSTAGRTDVMGAINPLIIGAALGPFTHTTEAFLGTDNYDFLVEGIPNFVAIQDDAPYVPNYHAASDTFDKVDARELKHNTAIAAVFVWELANAPAVPGPRQSRAEVEQLVQSTGLAKEMQTHGFWEDFVSESVAGCRRDAPASSGGSGSGGAAGGAVSNCSDGLPNWKSPASPGVAHVHQRQRQVSQ